MNKASDAGAGAGGAPPDPATLIPSQWERRQRIVLAALRLLEEQPYEKIQMRDVADEASVALGTVYRYFASKEHLFAGVLIEWSGVLGQRVQRRPLKGGTPAERLDDMMRRVLTSFERWPHFFGVVMLLQNTPDEYARADYATFAAYTSETFQRALDGLDHDDAESIMHVINAVLSQVLRSWIFGSLTMAEARRRMSRTIELVLADRPFEKER